MDKLEIKSLGKINLGLDVLGVRDNGYHDVRMVMQTLYLYDDVSITKSKESGIELQSNLYFLPTDERNIAYKAAKILLDEFQIKEGVSIHLQKRIPVAAGMAGGSSNAASVLFGVNKMFRLGLSQEELMKRGTALGADVPYCIMRGTVLAEGIGEELTRLKPLPKCYVLIAKPSFSVSTKWVYEMLDEAKVVTHPKIDEIITGLREQDLQKVADNMGNVLEEVTIARYPMIEVLKSQMKKAGALNAMMSGSGPTVFGIFTKRGEAKKAYTIIRKKGLAKQLYIANIHNVKGR
jgi:4-diphosphocytidyl-2C-methyl-D-erythritol kinase